MKMIVIAMKAKECMEERVAGCVCVEKKRERETETVRTERTE